MDFNLMNELNINENEGSEIIDYTQKCIEIYEQTLRDLGIFSIEVENCTIDNSQLVYKNDNRDEIEYGNHAKNY